MKTNLLNQTPKQMLLAGLTIMAAFMLMTLPQDAYAQFGGGSSTVNIPFVTDFGCNIFKWMRGPLAILIFVVVAVATLVVGMISKMDWSRIISVCVIFGIVVSLGSLLANSSMPGIAEVTQKCQLF